MNVEGLPCCGGYFYVYAANPPQTIRSHVPTCVLIPAGIPKPDANVCGNCGDVDDSWYWEEDINGAEWAFDGEWWWTERFPYLCSRACYLVVEGWKWSGVEGRWVRNA